MADEKPEQNNTLNKVARSVGSALGTVASTVNNIVGEHSAEKAPTKLPGKGSPGRPRVVKGESDERAVRAHDRLKEKRSKHRRKLHRKTRG